MTGRILETLVSGAANGAWTLLQSLNRRLAPGTMRPRWAPAPLLKSWEKSSPVLGWPRTTDSLCPTCVREVRARILAGEADVETLRT